MGTSGCLPAAVRGCGLYVADAHRPGQLVVPGMDAHEAVPGPDQFYPFGARPYFRAPHMYLAFPMRYVRWGKCPAAGQVQKQLGVGVSDTVFVSSRDGLHWDRRFLEAFIRPGLDPSSGPIAAITPRWDLFPPGTPEMSVYTWGTFARRFHVSGDR
ncbi:MAG: hypothetical protein Ct9H300mP1_25890 [Planctomycetaceae bacterium]|nr:MAG: hypothetical protein Ct9H300mP1_25890 [Planctomycetaceae bacterium]